MSVVPRRVRISWTVHRRRPEATLNDSHKVALDAFSKWSNYLLITTVAAIGWVSSGVIRFRSGFAESLTLWLLGASIVFAIFALALVPLIAEQITQDTTSIFRVKAHFSLFRIRCNAYLAQACRPQHVLFIAGIISYCWGVSGNTWLASMLGVAALGYGLLCRPRTAEPRSSEEKP
jgi:hypothetical protein